MEEQRPGAGERPGDRHRRHWWRGAGLAIDMLARLGYAVTALTGKEAETGYLRAWARPR